MYMYVYMANGNDNRSKLCAYTYIIWGSGCFLTSGAPSELHVALCLNYITSRC